MHITATSQIQFSSLQRFRNENETEEKGFYREEGSVWGPPLVNASGRPPLLVTPGRPRLLVASGRPPLPPCRLLVERAPQVSAL